LGFALLLSVPNPLLTEFVTLSKAEPHVVLQRTVNACNSQVLGYKG
jgi:hypothetical protein